MLSIFFSTDLGENPCTRFSLPTTDFRENWCSDFNNLVKDVDEMLHEFAVYFCPISTVCDREDCHGNLMSYCEFPTDLCS